MKKSNVAVGALVIVATAYIGGSWYMGKQTQQIIENGVIQINNRHAQMSSSLIDSTTELVKISSYERGVLSSEAVYVIELSNNTGQSKQYQIRTTIDHGPFPISALSQGKLQPLMAYSQAQMVVTPEVKEWFDDSQNPTPLTIETKVYIGGDARSDFNFAPLDLKLKNNNQIKFSGGQGSLYFSDKFANISGEANFDSYTVLNDASSERTELSGISLNSVTNIDGPKNTFDHLSNLQVNNILVTATDDGQDITIKGLSLDLNGNKHNGFLSGGFEYGFENIIIEDQDTGQFKLGASLSNIEEIAFNDLQNAYVEMASKRNLSVDADFSLTPSEEAEILNKIKPILAANPVFNLDPVHWSNSVGQSNAAMKLVFKDFVSKQPEPAELLQESIDNARLNVSINRAMTLDLLNQASKQAGESSNSADINKEMLQDYIETLASMGLINFDDESVTLDLYINPTKDEVILNDKTMTLQQFIMLGFGLMLAF